MEMIKIKSSNILHEAVKEERKAGTLTRGRAIRLHCLDCCGFSSHEVGLCKDKLCPLWEFRRTQREAREE